MRKSIQYLLVFLLVIFICFFVSNIFLKTYFNENFYSLPDFKGLTLDEVEKIDKIDNINLEIAGTAFTEFPIGVIFKQVPQANRVVKKGRTIKIWISKGKDNYIVPDFINQNYIEASARLQKDSVNIKYTTYTSSNLPYNTVLATTPPAGASAQKNQGVSFLLSNSDTTTTVEVPDTIGLVLSKAKEKLITNSLIIGTIQEKKVPDLDKGIVIETTNLGKTVPAGTIIDIIISK